MRRGFDISKVLAGVKKAIKPYPTPSVSVIGKDGGPFAVLVSCIISLRTRDEVTGPASSRLFKLATNPCELLKLSNKKIEKAIYPAAFFRNKAQSLKELCKQLVEKYDGNVPDKIFKRGTLLEIIIQKPDGTTEIKATPVSKTRKAYDYPLIFDSSSKSGKYEIALQFDGKIFAREEVFVKNSITTQKSIPKSLSVSDPKEIVRIPDWIKNNVKWWSQGAIDDQSFTSGIEFLITENVIDVPITTKTVSTNNEIPSWVRTNASWWADGQITDSDFVKGIEYLVNSGIINVKNTSISVKNSNVNVDSNTIPSTNSFNILNYKIEYTISGGTILGIQPDIDAKSLIVNIHAFADGSVTTIIPRVLIDSRINNVDDHFFVLVDGEEAIFDETSTSTDRVVTINFPKDAEEIEIIGTHVANR